MAKRKRLTLPGGLALDPPALPEAPPLYPLGVPPIARVAGEASANAALSDLAAEMARARDTGRLIQALPLEEIEDDYLMRDRMVADEDDLADLVASIQARGQQVPIEVAALASGRYGLISGWRRLTALRRLAAEDARFGRVLAILRHPEAASDAYLAMVEENEIRVGLSYYERARIVARAAEQGVFADPQAALSHLFGAASRAKRSKIGSFLRIVAALDDRLRFASHIPERLGLSLSRALEADPTLASRLRERLRKTPAETPAAELAALEKSLTAPPAAKPAAKPDLPQTVHPPPAPSLPELSLPEPAPSAPPAPRLTAPMPPYPLPGTQELPGVFVETGFGFVTLRGPKVTAWFQSQLLNLLHQMRD